MDILQPGEVEVHEGIQITTHDGQIEILIASFADDPTGQRYALIEHFNGEAEVTFAEVKMTEADFLGSFGFLPDPDLPGTWYTTGTASPVPDWVPLVGAMKMRRDTSGSDLVSKIRADLLGGKKPD